MTVVKPRSLGGLLSEKREQETEAAESAGRFDDESV